MNNTSVDPFFLLKEVVEMSKYDAEHSTDQQKANRVNYNALANQNYDQKVKTDGFDPLSIEEKIKKLKFAKVGEGTKDSNWYKNVNSKTAESTASAMNAST